MNAAAAPMTDVHPRTERSVQRAPLRARLRARLPEIATVVGLLVLLEALLFLGFFRGDVSPQFDFMGGYNAEAFAWWRDGGFVHPLEWMPYTWGGYPQAVALQTSSWYLPLGIPASIVDYTNHVAAIIQALHVAFGALGFYVLARRWELGRVAATLGLVAGFFAPGYFANAQHLDIVRGYAWAPWILLVLSPVWPWKRWWGVPLAAVMVFQAMVGIYPGMVVAFVYAGLVWVAMTQLLVRPRLREYLLPMLTAVVLGGLMATLKFLPAVLVRGAGSPTTSELSVFNLGILGTVFFPYDGENLPTDMSMRSYFLPATVVALLALVPWRDARVRTAAATATFCALVSLPIWPWFHALDALPGFDLSRFRFSDYRPLLLAAVLLMALVALSRAVHQDGTRRLAGTAWAFAWRRPVALTMLAGLLLGAALIGQLAAFSAPRWVPPWTILATAALFVAVLVGVGSPRWRVLVPDTRLVAGALVALTVVSGVSWAYSTTRPWRADRQAIELQTWGRTVDSMIAAREDPATVALSAVVPSQHRPPRTEQTQRPVPFLESQNMWNTAYYTGIASVGGYANLKGLESFTRLFHAYEDPATSEDALALYAAGGVVISGDADTVPNRRALRDCEASGECGDDLVVEPVEYAPGHLVYDVTTSGGPVQLNEASYVGWEGTLCATDGGACQDVPLTIARAGNIAADLPAGSWQLTVDYVTPGLRTAWLLFWAGVVGMVSWAAVTGALALRARRRPASPTDPDPSTQSTPVA